MSARNHEDFRDCPAHIGVGLSYSLEMTRRRALRSSFIAGILFFLRAGSTALILPAVMEQKAYAQSQTSTPQAMTMSAVRLAYRTSIKLSAGFYVVRLAYSPDGR